MRPTREITPDQLYWPNLIKPIVGVPREEFAEMPSDGEPDFAALLRREMDRLEANAAEVRVRGMKIGYPN